jgi:hypothetical protein
MRATILFLSVWSIVSCTPSADAQVLVNKGILVTRILARTRMGTCERGDLVHVTVRQPAGNKGFTVSVHAEYAAGPGKWQPVPPPKSPIGPWYTSANYGGLRDFVDANRVTENTDRNIALFMPFNGFTLEQGKDYDFRYVVRLWNASDKEIGHLDLDPYPVHVGRDRDGIIVSIIKTDACAFLVDPKAQSPSGVHAAGVVRFFNTSTGHWECPEGKHPTNATAAKQ